MFDRLAPSTEKVLRTCPISLEKNIVCVLLRFFTASIKQDIYPLQYPTFVQQLCMALGMNVHRSDCMSLHVSIFVPRKVCR